MADVPAAERVERPRVEIVLYSRPGCHLCADAGAALDTAGLAYDEVDITKDAGLEAEYRYVIPVVEVTGRQVFEAGMNPADLPGLVREAATPRG